MLQPQKHGGYSDYETILTSDSPGVAAERLPGRNATSLGRLLSSDESISRLNSDQSGGQC
jgi:hypothetical protein